MQFTAKLPDSQKLIITKAFWTGKTELRLDNVIIGKMGFSREQNFSIKYKDDSEHSLTVKHPWLDPMPIALLDGKDVFAAKRFDKIQTAVICLPVLLLLKLGLIPAIIGCGSVYLNFFLARQDSWKMPLRWTAILCVPVVGLVFILFISDMVWGKSVKPKSGYHIQTKAPTHQYDPTEDDNNPRLWARPRANQAEAERQERWVREER